MTILVTYASKHGATKSIAERIAQSLRAHGCDTRVLPIEAVEHVNEYEAVVIGSAVYFGAWRKEALDLVHRHRAALAARPVWFFSCGPVGMSDEHHDQPPKEIDALAADIRAMDYHVFFGALDPRSLSLGERLMLKAVHRPTGDFRHWDEIAAWAEEIADTMEIAQPSPPRLVRA